MLTQMNGHIIDFANKRFGLQGQCVDSLRGPLVRLQLHLLQLSLV